MKNTLPLFSKDRSVPRYIALLGFAILFLIIYFYLTADDRKPRWSGMTGVHHMGRNFVVSEFYINGYRGGNIGKEGGGGSNVCCVALPKKWHSGIVADVRWSVSDWSQENIEETSSGNYDSVSWKFFRAKVPVEKYVDEPDHVYIHFFNNGAVRVITSEVGSESPMHPIQREDSHALQSATIADSASSIFSESEMQEMRRKREENKENRGRWR